MQVDASMGADVYRIFLGGESGSAGAAGAEGEEAKNAKETTRSISDGIGCLFHVI